MSVRYGDKKNDVRLVRNNPASADVLYSIFEKKVVRRFGNLKKAFTFATRFDKKRILRRKQ